MPNEPQIPKWICNESHPRTENEPPQKDLVIEARELAEYADGLAAGLTSTKVSQIAVTLRQLCDEVERLRRVVNEWETAASAAFEEDTKWNLLTTPPL